MTTTDQTHAYVTRDTSRVHGTPLRGIEPGSNAEVEAARSAPAGTDLVDLSELDCEVDDGDQLVVDADGCATAIVY